jgi:hypothetical protein
MKTTGKDQQLEVSEAVHAGLVAFEKNYGTEAELLKQVRERVGQ